MDMNLDLDGAIRPGLDILANEIIIALKKRVRFKQNPEIYRPGLVIGRDDVSLLEYELARVERVHAELGRYLFATQEAYTDVSDVKMAIKRTPPESPVHPIPSGKGKELIQFYQQWIERACEPGTDSDTFGETVTADVAALQGISERITLGKYVAEYKYQQNTEAFVEANGDPARMRELIVNVEREKNVLVVAHQLATHYDFSTDHAQAICRWMIDMTIQVEIQYIQERIQKDN